MAPRPAGALLLNKLFGAPVLPARGYAIECLHTIYPGAGVCYIYEAVFDELVYRPGETGLGDALLFCFAIGVLDLSVISDLPVWPTILSVSVFLQAALSEKI